MNIDLLSISGHKIYGPKGIGALYVRRRPRVRLDPILSGGGQERGLRSGTLPHPLVAGFGAACELAMREMDRDAARVARLSARLLDGLQREIPHITVNGSLVHRYPGNLNVSFGYVEGESLLMALKTLPYRAAPRVPRRRLSRHMCSVRSGSRKTWRTRRFGSASAGLPPRRRSTTRSRCASSTSAVSARWYVCPRRARSGRRPASCVSHARLDRRSGGVRRARSGRWCKTASTSNRFNGLSRDVNVRCQRREREIKK